MRDSGFARAFKKLIVQRIEELVDDAERISISNNTPKYKQREIDKRIDAIQHNFNVYWMFFKIPHGQQEHILQNLKLLYRMQ